ncbi:MAG: 1-acyl-sn-glycerol-3-phosphate acyltransferase [bacterium]|nr:1-acyl-sn-glycerol-3-phosphate acyltransferase [bacterium]
MSLSLLWALLVKDPLIIASTVLMGSASVVASYFDRSGTTPDRIARRWARLLLWLAGVKVRVRGLENIDRSRRYVFVGNHLSLFDTPVVLPHIPVRFLFLVASRYVDMPFLGTHLRRSGHFSVELDDVRASLRTMTRAAAALQNRGVSLLVFPEGSRAPGEMEEFKQGAAYMAIKAGAPVVPFALRGTREVLAIGSLHVRGGNVDLVFGEPIDTSRYRLRDRAELTAMMRNAVAGLAAGIDAPTPEPSHTGLREVS